MANASGGKKCHSEPSEESRKSTQPPFSKGEIEGQRHSERSEESRKSPQPPFSKGEIEGQRHSERSEESRKSTCNL